MRDAMATATATATAEAPLPMPMKDFPLASTSRRLTVISAAGAHSSTADHDHSPYNTSTLPGSGMIAMLQIGTRRSCFTSALSCRGAFCGWCLADCGEEAHPHVRRCREAPRDHGPHGICQTVHS
jgi:hypothetical protein